MHICKECHKANVRKNYIDNIEHYKSYERGRAMLPHRVEARKRYESTPAGKAATDRARRRFIERNPEKRAAHIIVGNAVRDGKLHKQPCEVCGAADVHAHHDDYSKPLNVRWLCPSHHSEHHKEHAA